MLKNIKVSQQRNSESEQERRDGERKGYVNDKLQQIQTTNHFNKTADMVTMTHLLNLAGQLLCGINQIKNDMVIN